MQGAVQDEIINCEMYMLLYMLKLGEAGLEKILVKAGEPTVLLEQNNEWVAVGNATADKIRSSTNRSASTQSERFK